MKVLNLRCGAEHAFEGWFSTIDECEQQLAQGRLQCPLCGNADVLRTPTAARIHASRSREVDAAGHTASDATATQVPSPARWMQAMREALARIDDVGDRFAEEARRIHYGEVDERAIRGQATPDEAASLRDEGIEVMTLALPAALKEPLQ